MFSSSIDLRTENAIECPALAADLVRLKVDVIVTGGSGATRPAKEATKTIPIVMAQDTDPLGNGFVASLARPGGNITGLSTLQVDLTGKRLELLKEVVPEALPCRGYRIFDIGRQCTRVERNRSRGGRVRAKNTIFRYRSTQGHRVQASSCAQGAT